MKPEPDADVAALRELVEQMDSLQNEPEGFAGLFMADAELVNAIGRRVVGREAIREALTAGLATALAGATTRYEMHSHRFLAPDIAVVSGAKRMLAEGSPHAAPGSTIEFSLVAARTRDGWRVALAHNTLVRA